MEKAISSYFEQQITDGKIYPMNNLAVVLLTNFEVPSYCDLYLTLRL